MSTPEGEVKQPAWEYARSLHLQYRQVQWVGRKGCPDTMFWGEGVLPFMIEFKAPGQKLDKRGPQYREVQSLRRSGMAVYLCDNLEDAKHIIQSHANAAHVR